MRIAASKWWQSFLFFLLNFNLCFFLKCLTALTSPLFSVISKMLSPLHKSFIRPSLNSSMYSYIAIGFLHSNCLQTKSGIIYGKCNTSTSRPFLDFMNVFLEVFLFTVVHCKKKKLLLYLVHHTYLPFVQCREELLVVKLLWLLNCSPTCHDFHGWLQQHYWIFGADLNIGS